MKNPKWTKWDIFILFLEIISVLVSIIVALIPEDKLLSSTKLTIICACIGLPIIILQASLTVGQNKTCEKISELTDSYNSLKEEIDNITHYISPLFTIYSSQNERVRRFADRRISEMIKTLTTANKNGNSGLLDVREYYNELDFMADKLELDSGTNCFIWAMTGFAPNEWSAAGGYERAWTRRLQNLANKKIKTIRLCLLSKEIINKITDKNFSISRNGKKGSAIDGFISLLKQYYQGNSSNCEHYVVLNNEFAKLDEVKGFFGIVLSNGEKHIVLGEAVNLDKGLTGNVLFDVEQIDKIHTEFEHACNPEREIIKYINDNASDTFKQYLKNQNINL